MNAALKRVALGWLKLEAIQLSFTIGAICGMLAMAVMITVPQVLVVVLSARGVL